MAGHVLSRWAVELFQEIPHNALSHCVRVVSPTHDREEHPLGFADIWRPPDSPNDETKLSLADVVFCVDITDGFQYQLARQVVRGLYAHPNCPRQLLLFPRAVPSYATESSRSAFQQRVLSLMQEGFDDIFAYYSTGWALALQIHAKVWAAEQSFERNMTEYERREQQGRSVLNRRRVIDHAMWHYLPPKVTRMIPRVARNLHDTPLRDSVAGNIFVRRLGAGCYGKVFASLPAHLWETGQTEPTDAIKVVDKSTMFGLRDIKMLHHMITAYNLLSSPRMAHPNVAVLRSIYHSPSHLFFRMEYAGSESLYARLSSSSLSTREEIAEATAAPRLSLSEPLSGGKKPAKPPSLPLVVQDVAAFAREHGALDRKVLQHRPLTTGGLQAILEQAAAAVAHLHLQAGVCHRDLKPENFVVQADCVGARETPRIKLVDFDFARVVVAQPTEGDEDPGAFGEPFAPSGPNGRACRGRIGTIPYIAPEVIRERQYDGMVADVWGLGILFLEVLCGVRVVEKAVGLQFNMNYCEGKILEPVTARIVREIKHPGFLTGVLQERAKGEARPLVALPRDLHGIVGIVRGMLELKPQQRAGIARVQAVLQDLPSLAAEAC